MFFQIQNESRSKLYSLVSLLCLSSITFAANLSGHVFNDKSEPLTATTITIPALRLGTSADADGAFSFDNVPHGIFVVQFDLLGYKTEARTIELTDSTHSLEITLHESPLQFSPITVTALPRPTDVLRSPQSVSVLDGRQLDQQRGQTITETIKNSPGVSAYSTGSAISKPVIRGLTSQRVLVVSDGVRQEGQQWGDEHAPEIDALDIECIEVVRGPNSVLYGSDALGGVIHIIKPEPPTAETSPRLKGQVLVNGMSNSGRAGAVGLSGAVKQVGYRGNLSVHDSGNTDTPNGKLSNSAEEGVNGAAAIGIQGNWGSLSGDFGHFGSRLEIHEDPEEEPDFTGFQRVGHNYVHLHSLLPASSWRVELDGGWQGNDRREFEEKSAADPVLHLKLATATFDIKAHHNPIGK